MLHFRRVGQRFVGTALGKRGTSPEDLIPSGEVNMNWILYWALIQKLMQRRSENTGGKHEVSVMANSGTKEGLMEVVLF